MSDEQAEWIRRKQDELLANIAAAQALPTPEELEAVRQLESGQGHPLTPQERNVIITQMRQISEL